MALLPELGKYSLTVLKNVPEEKVCAGVARQWEISGNKDLQKVPVISTTIKRQPKKPRNYQYPL